MGCVEALFRSQKGHMIFWVVRIPVTLSKSIHFKPSVCYYK